MRPTTTATCSCTIVIACVLCSFHIVKPPGYCGNEPCQTGCQPLHGSKLHLPTDQATMLWLDGQITPGCTDLRRAYNAAMAGATGVVITTPASESWAKSTTPVIDPNKDDLDSIRHVNIPVGAIPDNQGMRAFVS